MTRVLPFLAVLALLTPAAVAADAPAVTLYGGKLKFLKSNTVNRETIVSMKLTIDKDVALEVVGKDPGGFAKAYALGSEERAKDYEKRTKDLQAQIKTAVTKGDDKKVEELTETLQKEAEDFLFVPVVAMGKLTYKDSQWQLTGSVRTLEPEKKDKDVKRGSCVVQGELVKGKFTAGEFTSPLAVKAGGLTIVLTEVDAKDPPKGVVRATGTLNLFDEGEAMLEVTKIEAVKK